jgi:hypothetical protein
MYYRPVYRLTSSAIRLGPDLEVSTVAAKRTQERVSDRSSDRVESLVLDNAHMTW